MAALREFYAFTNSALLDVYRDVKCWYQGVRDVVTL